MVSIALAESIQSLRRNVDRSVPALIKARSDAIGAVAVGVVALAVYVRTLAPGLIGIIDTPMFQFIGRVLGVAHNPGYPLYVLVTHPFSYLPVGSLAYRINLFSAVCGALTVALAFLIARRLDSSVTASVAASLGLAFGGVFWSQAVIAEVYTLNAAIVAGMILALVIWERSRHPRAFFVAVALFALGLGNHTTIVGFAPGLLIAAWLIDRRFLLRLGTVTVSAVIVCAGLLQYGFILIRSRQPGVYLESSATNLSQLFDIMRGRQFGNRLFMFDWRTVAFERVPSLVRQVLIPELTVTGMLAAVIGIAFLLRRRLAEGLFIVLGGCAVFAFVVNYGVIDSDVFLIPVILVLWCCAAVGWQQAARFAATLSPRSGPILLAATLLFPVANLIRNANANDLSGKVDDEVYFDRLFQSLPDRALFVREDFLVDRMVSYERLGAGAARGRQILLGAPDAAAVRKMMADGFAIFGFGKSARRLRLQGLDFDFTSGRLLDAAWPEVLARLPRGTIVAIGVPAVHAAQFAATGSDNYRRIGGSSDLRGRIQSNVAIVGVCGARTGAVESVVSNDRVVRIAAGERIGTTGVVAPADIEMDVRADQAAIRTGSRDLVRTSAGAAVAIWRPDGVRRTFTLEASDRFAVPVLPGPLAVYRLRGELRGQDVGITNWGDVTPMTSAGTLLLKTPGAAATVLYLAADRALAPRILDQSSGSVRIDVRELGSLTSAARTELEGTEPLPQSLLRASSVYRVQVDASSQEPGTGSLLLALGGVPVFATGRVFPLGPNASTPSGSHAMVATISRVNTEGLLRTPDRLTELLLMSRDDQAQLIGDGWSPVDTDGVSPYRWMTKPEAHLLLPLANDRPIRITVEALHQSGAAARLIGLRLNGVELPPQPMQPGWNVYDWTLPSGALHRGVNQATVTIDVPAAPSTSQLRDIAVTTIAVRFPDRRSN